MGRPETPLDPDTSPVAAFAARLRALRVSAGTPSYRTLAHKTHYSVTTLSQAAAGRTVPSLPVLLAFVEACGGDRAEWEGRWRDLRTSGDLDSPPSPDSLSSPYLPDPAGSGLVAPVGTSATATATEVVTAPPRPATHWPLIVALVISLLVAATTTTLLFQVYRPSLFSHGGGVGATDPVADGSDPNRAGCANGAATIGQIPVYFPGTSYAGDLELRYSARCHAAWSRFQPAKTWHPGEGMIVTLWTFRPKDQVTVNYSVPFAGPDIIGDMLLTPGCIGVEITLAQGDLKSPVGTVTCQQMA